MDTTRHRRLLPGAILVACVSVAAAYAVIDARRASGVAERAGEGASDEAGALAALETTIGRGDADAQTWTRYAEALNDRGEHRTAAQAYEMALKQDPVNRDLLFRRGLMLALTKDADAFHDCVARLLRTDPRLTYDLLSREECAAYLADPRFKRIYEDAFDQYLD